jgi:hypothetical protein
MRNTLIATLLILYGVTCFADELCEKNRGFKTPYGRVTTTECTDLNGTPTRQWISLNDKKLLEDKILSADFAIEKTRTYLIFSGKAKQNTGCPSHLYLIDLSKQPVKVIAFGIKKACNTFHWASWGENRSIIALKNNVKFTYENGKMTLPEGGEKLWSAIEPPHAGVGLKLEDAVPFSEDVTPPSK